MIEEEEKFYRNNKDLIKPTYVAFMDVKSVFDVVVYENLMRKLYHNPQLAIYMGPIWSPIWAPIWDPYGQCNPVPYGSHMGWPM